MADFYVNYGSNGARLVGIYSLSDINIKLHRLKTGLFVLSKNRKIISKSYDYNTAYKVFQNLIFLEMPDLLL